MPHFLSLPGLGARASNENESLWLSKVIIGSKIRCKGEKAVNKRAAIFSLLTRRREKNLRRSLRQFVACFRALLASATSVLVGFSVLSR